MGAGGGPAGRGEAELTEDPPEAERGNGTRWGPSAGGRWRPQTLVAAADTSGSRASPPTPSEKERLPRTGNPGRARPAGRGRGSRPPRLGAQAGAARAREVAARGAGIQLSLPDLASGARGCEQPGSRWQLCLPLLTWPVAGTERGRRWPKFGAASGGARARRLDGRPDAKASEARRVRRLRAARRGPAPAAALTKIGIAAAAGAGAAPRTRPAPRRPTRAEPPPSARTPLRRRVAQPWTL